MVICVVGLGYVGLPLALAFSKKGIKVIGYDTSLKRIAGLQKSIDKNGEFSKKNVSKNFSHDKMCKLTLSLYKRCLAEYKQQI